LLKPKSRPAIDTAPIPASGRSEPPASAQPR
jgi:hypothetical protein